MHVIYICKFFGENSSAISFKLENLGFREYFKIKLRNYDFKENDFWKVENFEFFYHLKKNI